MQISWLRSCIGLLLIATFTVLTGRLGQLKSRNPAGHLFRGVLNCAAIISIFFSLKYVPAAEYVSLTFAAPFIIALLSPLVLKEQVSRQSWYAIIIGFIGILIVLRPTPDHFHIAHLSSLFVAFAIAGLSLSGRYMARTETSVALNFYIYPLNIFFSAWWAIPDWVMPTFTDWLLFCLMGCASTAALGCFIQALRYARATVVAPIDYARLVWMTLLGYLAWNEFPSLITWVGIAIIISSGIFVVTHGRKLPELETDRETRTGAL